MLDEGGMGGEGSFCVAFQKPGKALPWCVAVQEKLLAAKWPGPLLAQKGATEERDNQGGVIYRGLRVRMGINYGTPKAEKETSTMRVEYMGTPVHVAAHLATTAQGGQILLTQEMQEKVKDKDFVSKKGQLIKLGKLRTTATEGNEGNTVYEFKPTSLRGRQFGNPVSYVLSQLTRHYSGVAKSEGSKKKGDSDSESDDEIELGDDPQSK